MKPIKINPGVFWVGVNDRVTELFEGLWPISEGGISYNSYLIHDEKSAIIDLSKEMLGEDYLAQLAEVFDISELDYVVINHMEPDHSGALRRLLSIAPQVKILGMPKTVAMLKDFYNITENVERLSNGQELSLGEKTLRFVYTPFVHWPETMMTYDQTEKILFSGDAFGSFGTLDGGIFDDEINFDFYLEDMRRYFSNIVGKYSNMVQKAFKKLEGVDVQMVAATHGPIWRSQPEKVLSLYDQWSRFESEKGVVIIVGSMYGNTERMADYIARKIAEQGIKNIRVRDASKTHLSYLINDIWRFRGVILGSAAYNSGMLPPMEHLTNTLEHTGAKNHYLGLFGSHSWTGGGVKKLKQFAENVDWEMVADPVDIKGVPGNEAFQQCEQLALNMANKLNEMD